MSDSITERILSLHVQFKEHFLGLTQKQVRETIQSNNNDKIYYGATGIITVPHIC